MSFRQRAQMFVLYTYMWCHGRSSHCPLFLHICSAMVGVPIVPSYPHYPQGGGGGGGGSGCKHLGGLASQLIDPNREGLAQSFGGKHLPP